MKISILAKETGVSIHTIRYYEKIGLIQISKSGYYKDYTKEVQETLDLIQRLKGIGFSLSQIKELFSISANNKEDLTYEEYARLSKIIENAFLTLKAKEQELAFSRQLIEKMMEKLKGLFDED